MRWFKTTLDSLYTVLEHFDRLAEPADTDRTEHIRLAMLEALSEAGLELRCRTVFNKIRFADSIHSLWYARSDVMTAVAGERGEHFARQCLIGITRLFVGVLPEAGGNRSLWRVLRRPVTVLGSTSLATQWREKATRKSPTSP